ncbi:MAG: FlgD immunoglobulin-like domain containing protein [Bacteroidota bacterium]
MSNLTDGNHTLKVRAWDVHNNSTMEESYFTVASSGALSIQQLYNFPNPVTTRTAFTFQHNQLTPIDVKISIYTVSGRLIHTIERFAVQERFVKIDWDRRDSDGDEVGNGLYLYKVTAKTIDGKYSSEALGKLAVIR